MGFSVGAVRAKAIVCAIVELVRGELVFGPDSTYLLGERGTRLWNTTQPYRRAYTVLVDTNNLGIVHSEHHMLVTALRDGDLDLAEQIVAQHIRRTRLHLERHPEVFNIQSDHTK
ncbi:MAG: hypothetical protein RL107_222 [Actinomycetota bacterium]